MSFGCTIQLRRLIKPQTIHHNFLCFFPTTRINLARNMYPMIKIDI